MVISYCLDTDYISCFFRDTVAFYALTATLLQCKFIKIGSLAHTHLRSDQKRITLCIELHSNDLITIIKIHTDDTHRISSHRTYIRLFEADTHTILCDKENL